MDRKLTKWHREIVGVLPNIRRYALSLAGNVADADDLLQSTVERVLAKGLPDGANLVPWCLRVCRNLWIDEVRARRVRHEAHRDPAVAGEQVLAGEQQVLGELTLAEVQQAFLALAEDHREVLELVAVEGHSYREAAGILDVPVGTVMSRLARARAALIDKSQAGGA